MCVDKMHIVRSEGSNSKATLRENGEGWRWLWNSKDFAVEDYLKVLELLSQ